MKFLILIVYLLVLVGFFVYKSTLVNFIRVNDLKVSHYLREKNPNWGYCYDGFKLFLFSLVFLYFLYSSIMFLKGFLRLKESQVYIGFAFFNTSFYSTHILAFFNT